MPNVNVEQLLERIRDRQSRPVNPSRAALRKAQNRRCFYCYCKLTRATETKDHVTPLRYGGTSPGNIVLACKKCNQEKADDMPTPEELIRLREVHQRAWLFDTHGKQRVVAYAERLIAQALERKTSRKVRL